MRGISKPALVASLLVSTPVGAWAQAPGNITAAGLQYPTGSFFYGEDCGGNAIATRAPLKAGPAGVILSGATGTALIRALNCDDRRHALPSYQQAFEGTLGQSYRWRNPNGAVTGDVMATDRFQNAGLACISFVAMTNLGQSLSTTGGTACRQPDGNWHLR
jgi:surface antigen